MKFSLIAAVDSKMGIGKNGNLAWHLPADMEYFRRVTSGNGKNAIIMGRTTWESIPNWRKPLKDRLNIVLTTQKNYFVPEGVPRAGSLAEALAIAEAQKCEYVFVIGGAKVFVSAMAHPDCAKIYLTHIESDFDCDTFFPPVDLEKFTLASASEQLEEHGLKFQFALYEALIQ